MSLQHTVLTKGRLQAVYVVQPNGKVTRRTAATVRCRGTQHTLS